MKLLILSLVIAALASCKQGVSVTNNNAVAIRAVEAPAPKTTPNPNCVNLNTATSVELIKLPGIGEVMANRIIAHRERHGRFRRSEEVIIIEGFSERKYRAIAEMICVD